MRIEERKRKGVDGVLKSKNIVHSHVNQVWVYHLNWSYFKSDLSRIYRYRAYIITFYQIFN